MSKNVYVSLNYEHEYGVPGSAVIVADNEDEARQLLDAQLASYGLKPHAEHPYTLNLVDVGLSHVASFESGDY